MLHRNMLRSHAIFARSTCSSPRSIAVIGSQTASGRVFVRNMQQAGFPASCTSSTTRPRSKLRPDLGIVATDDAAAWPRCAGRAGRPAAILATPAPGGPPVPRARTRRVRRHRSRRRAERVARPPAGPAGQARAGLALGRAVPHACWTGRSRTASASATSSAPAARRNRLRRHAGHPVPRARHRRHPARHPHASATAARFLSAARAAARLRPVVAIHAGGRQHDPSGRSRPRVRGGAAPGRRAAGDDDGRAAGRRRDADPRPPAAQRDADDRHQRGRPRPAGGRPGGARRHPARRAGRRRAGRRCSAQPAAAADRSRAMVWTGDGRSRPGSPKPSP